MATVGVPITAVRLGDVGNTDGDLWFTGANVATGGTVTQFNWHGRNRAGNAAFNDYRIAIYAGGSISGPSGATKIWDSGQLFHVDIGNTRDWNTLAASGSFSAGWVWACLLCADGIDMETVDGATDEGDWNAFGHSGVYAGAYSTATALPDPHPGNQTSAAETLSCYITYTPTATTAIPIFQNNYQ